MRWLYVMLVFVFLIGIPACGNLFPTQDTPEQKMEYDSYINISNAVVMQIQHETPRSIIINHKAEGTSQVWFDEEPDDVGFIVNTQFYSIDGCPLPGPPLLPGDTVKVAGHMDEESRLVADFIWILNNEVGDENCFGPPADSPELVVP